MNVAGHLPTRATSQPYRIAALQPCGKDGQGRTAYVHDTYQQLDTISRRYALWLAERGVQRGVRTVLMVPPSLDFFALTFALFRVGAVPVVVDPGIGLANLKACLAEAEPHAFVGIAKAHLARKLLGWAPSAKVATVLVGPGVGGLARYRLPRGLRRQDPDAPSATARGDQVADLGPDELAAILFTSGSTGVPKGVEYTHAIFEGQVAALRQAYDIREDEVDLCTFPLFALFAPALGMTAVIPQMNPTRPAKAAPAKLVAAIQDFGVTNLFGSPALLNTLGRYGEKHGVTLPTLRRAISAGAPVPARVVERIARMLPPGSQVHTPYGATESLPVSTIASDEILGECRAKTEAGAGVCVGRPVGNVEVRLIEITDGPVRRWAYARPVAQGEVGEICVRGPVVTRAYFRRPEATELAKISDGDGFWHRMGDVGRFDEQGRLWFCGRKKHRVELPGGETLFSVPIEAIFDTHPAVYRTALVGVPEPVLCVELEPEAPPERWPAIRAELEAMAQQHPQTQPITTFLRHPAFPVDIRHNAKIFREKLALWAAKQLDKWIAEPPPRASG